MLPVEVLVPGANPRTVHTNTGKHHIPFVLRISSFTPKTAFYKALTTDYLDINRELNNHF